MWEKTEKVINDYGVALRNAYQDNLIKNGRIATGDLLNGVDLLIKKDNVSIKLYFDLADYWKYVEYDTKPHFPPVDKIREWIRVKPVLPDDRGGRLPTPDQLAYLIGRKISVEGTKGSHDLGDAQERVFAEFEEALSNALMEDVTSEFDLVVQSFYRTLT